MTPGGNGLFGFLSNDSKSRPEGEGSMLRELANMISAELEKSDAKIGARLDAFSQRLDTFENRLQEATVAKSSGKANVADVNRRMAKMSCASSESLTLAERQNLIKEMEEFSVVSRPTASTSLTESSITSAVAAPDHDASFALDSTAARGGLDASGLASQRERYLAKFEKSEIFGKSQDELDQEKTILAERMREKLGGGTVGGKCMLMPGSGIRLAWDAVSVLLVFYVSIALPYQVAFLMDYMDAGLSIMDFFIDCFFLCDIIINFRTAILHDGELVSNPIAVARNYVRLWFWLDLLSSIPFDWFVGGFDLTTTKFIGVQYAVNSTTGEMVRVSGSSVESDDALKLAGIVRVFKVVKLLRLLRVVRLFRYVSRWEQTFVVISSTTLRMLKLVVILLMFSHWNGCFQFMIAALQRKDGLFLEESWVYRANIEGEDPLLQWSWSFFHAASQLLAISVGIVQPRTPSEIWVYLMSMLMGATLYAVFVATVTAFFADADPSAREFRSKVDMVNQYMRHAQLPHRLRLKLRTYYQLRFPGHRAFDEENILSELSAPLTHEVRLQKCQGVLTALNILEKDDPAIAFYLCDKLNRIVFVAGDYVIREGQEAAGMYFISSGLVEVVSSSAPGEVITTLGAQSFFGEMALLNPTGETTASVVVRTYLEGYLLAKADYAWLERHHPAFRDYLASAARLRLVRMQERMKEKISDTAKLNALFDVIDPVKRRLVRRAAREPDRKSSTVGIVRGRDSKRANSGAGAPASAPVAGSGRDQSIIGRMMSAVASPRSATPTSGRAPADVRSPPGGKPSCRGPTSRTAPTSSRTAQRPPICAPSTSKKEGDAPVAV